MTRSALPTAVLVAAAALVALLVYGVVARGTNTTLDDAVKRGDTPKAPGRTRALPRLGGPGTRTLASLGGKVVVLNFWASWCEPCRAEAPVLERAQRALTAAGAGTVLGATYNNVPAESLKFIRRYSVNYPSVRDVGTKLAKDYATNKLPETFVINGRGNVVAISRGQLSQAFLDRAVAKARRTS